jgi:hypothetical protein
VANCPRQDIDFPGCSPQAAIYSEWWLHAQIVKLNIVVVHSCLQSAVTLQDTQPDDVICTSLVPWVVTSIDDTASLGLYHGI